MTKSVRILRDDKTTELVVYDDNWKRHVFPLNPDQLVMLLESASGVVWRHYDLVSRAANPKTP